MGNCCGKLPSSSKNFSSPGRTLGAAPTNDTPENPPRAIVPSNVGSSNQTKSQGSQATGSGPSEARAAAAKAAEERAAREGSAPKGKLGQALAEDRKQTRTDTLQAAAAEDLRRREMDANAEVRNWD